MYKKKVEIPPLMMQDDTLAISTCGFETTQMNSFINTRSNIMGLQFGRDKCVKMHYGKKHNIDVCSNCKVDAWRDRVVTNETGKEELIDEYVGEENMKLVNEKKYLGDIFTDDMKNIQNIREKTNRAVGIVNKITTCLIERPYGKHNFSAALLMRESMLIGTLLNNSESWINLTKKDIESIEKPDVMLLRKVLGSSGNPNKVFLYLELGILPARFVIMKKRLNFLRYILKEDMGSMIRQVYEALKTESRNGDFVNLVKKDMDELDIQLSEEDIKNTTKLVWKNFVNEKVVEECLRFLTEENSEKSKTTHITFESLEMREYLRQNNNIFISKTIFSARSGTLDIKEWNSWNYKDKLCVMCKLWEENFKHFMTCSAYGNNPLVIHWSEIFGNDADKQVTIAKDIKRRQFLRKRKQEEVGLPPTLAPMLQKSSVELQ